jgi:phosphoglycerate dehydrogenase-like enzyme
MTLGEAPAVTITWPDYRVDAAALGRALRDAGLQPRLAPKLGARTPAELKGLLAGAVGAIVSTDPFDADVLHGSPDLRVIARVGVGTDSIDLAAATERGVVVTVTPGANEATVADHTLALMLALVRRVCEQHVATRLGMWNRTGPHVAGTLHGSTVGLVGYGRIGRLVARRLRAFDVRVLATDPGVEDADVELVELPVLLAASDIVSLHAPLAASTTGLIGAAELRRMRPGAMLVNTARGGMVDEEALYDALYAGHLGGAALDVFAHEPPGGNALLRLPNVVVTAHVAGLSARSIDEMTRRATASVVDVVAGRRPADVANPAVFDHLRHG